jgi:hypothetical protein
MKANIIKLHPHPSPLPEGEGADGAAAPLCEVSFLVSSDNSSGSLSVGERVRVKGWFSIARAPSNEELHLSIGHDNGSQIRGGITNP